jgi:nucleoside-diphosphate-sugar epimerase
LARSLIIGCGCRGRSLARALHDRGHAVRGSTRRRAQFAEIEAAGAEPWLADPDRIATITPAFEHVSVVCILLGSVAGSPDQVSAIHHSRLDMMLTRMLDTTVRGVVYETSGLVDQDVLEAGGQMVEHVCASSHMPYALLDREPADHAAWLEAAVESVERVLGGD